LALELTGKMWLEQLPKLPKDPATVPDREGNVRNRSERVFVALLVGVLGFCSRIARLTRPISVPGAKSK
jgi:hypothetical protein